MLMQESKIARFGEGLLSLRQAPHQNSGSVSSESIVVLGPLTRNNDIRQAALEVCQSWTGAFGDVTRCPGLSRVVVVLGPGPLALLANLCWLVPRRALLFIYLGEPPRALSWLQKSVLKRADTILVHGDATSLAFSRLGTPIYRIRPEEGLDRYLKVSLVRQPKRVRRIIVVGDLTPGSGAFDFLAALAAWAETNAGHKLSLSWAGQGDLAGMLAAQPLPDNLSQTFHDVIGDRDLASLFEQADLLAVPDVAESRRSRVTEALAAGLPVLGSLRSGEVRRHVTDGVTGWLFDPLRPGEMLDAIGCALATSDDHLSEMRPRARAAMSLPPVYRSPSSSSGPGLVPPELA